MLDNTAWQLDPELEERALKYMTLGGRQGIDGMWHSTDENRLKSLERYFAPPHENTPDELELADRVAEAMYEKHKIAFEAPEVVSPRTVWNPFDAR